MRKSIIILIVFVLLIGVYLLMDGITGYIVSQSCCFPPNCVEEYYCDNIERLSPPNSNEPIYIGTMVLVISISMYLFTKFKHKRLLKK